MNCITHIYSVLRILAILFLGNGIFVSILVAEEANHPSSIHWEDNLDVAKNRAFQERKPLLIHFYGDYCTPCKAMERDIFSQLEIIQKINSEFVAVKINTTQNQQILPLFGVRYIPTDVYLSPSGERIDAKVVAGVTAVQYFAELIRITDSMPQPVYASQQAVNAMSVQSSVFVEDVNLIQNNDMPQSDNLEGFAVSGVKTKTPQTTNDTLAERFIPNQTVVPSTVSNQISANQNQMPVNLPSNSGDTIVPIQYTYTFSPPQSAQPSQQQSVATVVQQPPQQEVSRNNNAIANNLPFANTPPVVNNMPTVNNSNNNFLSDNAGFVAHSNSASTTEIVSTSGVIENGHPRKQPVTGLEAGMSFGVLSSINNDVSEQHKPLALDGYCPIALAEKTEWVKGNPAITVEYEGVVFRFCSAESQIKFTSRPEIYAPIIKGHDVVEWIINRHEISGNRKFGAWYYGRIFLFANSENYEKFKTNPEFYAQPFLQTSTIIASAEEVKN
ncbi:MAG: thioredoxin family protein [Planctomycetaceae bacterium]|jgi:YHS domain-containing protein/thiol-disulfide isomerase/thioredoxin|nr:thioredoxin family protein [Planctomycetaceae bacterium]